MPESKSHQVLLIHGTAAASDADAGDRWWQRDSYFWNWLNTRLMPQGGDDLKQASVFHWDGNNSEKSRQAAGRKLLDALLRLEQSGCNYHLIGHSHGGSVIWNALCEAERRNLPLTGLISWATVGTPFLHYRPRLTDLWLLLPLTLAGTALFVMAPQTAATVKYWGEIWIDGSVLDLGLLALFCLILLVCLAYCGIRLISLLRACFSTANFRRNENKAFARYGSRWLGLWSPDDEAINGLKSTLQLGGRIVPRLAPVSLIGPVGDGLFWDWLRAKVQGNDRAGFWLYRVSEAPLEGRTYPPLDDPALLDSRVNLRLIEYAQRKAPESVTALRRVLGRLGAGSASLVETPLSLQEEGLAWDALLVHTSYFSNSAQNDSEISELLALHIEHCIQELEGRETIASSQAPLACWLIGARLQLMKPLNTEGRPFRESSIDCDRPENKSPPKTQDRSSRPSRGWARTAVDVMSMLALLLIACLGWSSVMNQRVAKFTDEYQIPRAYAESLTLADGLESPASRCGVLASVATLGDLAEAKINFFPSPDAVFDLAIAELDEIENGGNTTDWDEGFAELLKHMPSNPKQQWWVLLRASIEKEKKRRKPPSDDYFIGDVVVLLADADFVDEVVNWHKPKSKGQDSDTVPLAIAAAHARRGDVAKAIELVRNLPFSDQYDSRWLDVMTMMAANGHSDLAVKKVEQMESPAHRSLILHAIYLAIPRSPNGDSPEVSAAKRAIADEGVAAAREAIERTKGAGKTSGFVLAEYAKAAAYSWASIEGESGESGTRSQLVDKAEMAARQFMMVAKAPPGDAVIATRKAIQAMAIYFAGQQSYREAVARLRKGGDSGDSLIMVVKSLTKAGKLDEALGLTKENGLEYLPRSVPTISAYMEVAVALAERNRVAESNQVFDIAATELGNENIPAVARWSAFRELAVARARVGQHDQAVSLAEGIQGMNSARHRSQALADVAERMVAERKLYRVRKTCADCLPQDRLRVYSTILRHAGGSGGGSSSW